MGWEQAAAGFREIPKGKTAAKIWLNPAVYPIFGVLGAASFVCGGYLFKYFTGHADIAFSKSVRMDHNHQGCTDARVAAHNSRFGMREINKRSFNVFPFSWSSKDAIIEAHRSD